MSAFHAKERIHFFISKKTANFLKHADYDPSGVLASPTRPACRSGTESLMTLRWRELDSNFWFRARFGSVFVVSLLGLRFVGLARLILPRGQAKMRRADLQPKAAQHPAEAHLDVVVLRLQQRHRTHFQDRRRWRAHRPLRGGQRHSDPTGERFDSEGFCQHLRQVADTSRRGVRCYSF